MMYDGRKRIIKIFRGIMSVLLIIAMFVTGSLREYGPVAAQAIEDESVTYVKDIRLFYSLTSQADAERLCEEKGYIPVKGGDLNSGAGKDFVIMGYMETDNREDAITSIKTLSMGSGYEMKDYKELQKEYESSNADVIDTIYSAAIEFTSNYEAGSPKAKQAYEGLNLIDVPEADDMKLGDYIVKGIADREFFAQIVCRASAGTISAVVGYLSLGLAAYENEIDPDTGEMVSSSWAENVSKSYVWEELEEATTQDQYDALYKQYGDDAKAFHKQLQKFADNYEFAFTTFDEEKLKEDLKATEDLSDDEMLDDKEKLNDNEQGVVYLGIYEELQKYDANEDYPLGEYLLDIGHESADDVDLTKLYPVLDSMSYAQKEMINITGLSALAATSGENKEDEEIEEKISETAEKLQGLIGKSSYSVWMNKNEEIKDKKVAYTSDAVRMNAAQKIVDEQVSDTWEEDAQTITNWINIAVGIVWCVLLITKVVTGIIVSHLAAAAGVAVAAYTVSGALSVATTIGGLSNPVGWIMLAVLVVSMLVIWVVKLIRKEIKENMSTQYEEAPDYVADCVEIEGQDKILFYKSVGSDQTFSDYEEDSDGRQKRRSDILGDPGIGDVNGRMGFRGWNLMYYSKEEGIGSPIIIRNGECPFVIKMGDNGSSNLKGLDSVKAYGQIMPSNCNYLMKEDKNGGVYLHYTTEKSVLNGSGSDDTAGDESATQTGVYYKDIIVRSADTPEAAKAKITAKKGFQIWDVNLAGDARKNYSPYEEWAYTYLGFTTTTDPKKAITDIRVATYTPESTKQVTFGDVTYGCAGNLGYKAENTTEDKEYPSNLDGLWITTDEKAGTPIEVGGLHCVSDHADGEYVNKGWIPITTFSGVPYNFASTRDKDTTSWKASMLGKSTRLGAWGYDYTGYCAVNDHDWSCKANYLYYEPQVKYTSGTKYLSGLFFTHGVNTEDDIKAGDVLTDYTELTDRMKKTPNTVIQDGNLSSSYYYKGFITESNQKYMNLGYSWSYSPYRAFTDIKAFQGTNLTSSLPYNINKSVSISAKGDPKNVGYDAVTVVSQRCGYNQKYVIRGIGPENAYMAPNGLDGSNTDVREGYTEYKPGGYAYSQKHMAFIASGLYISGPTDGMEKLTLDDVIISQKAHYATSKDGVISTDVSGEKTLGGSDAQGDFNSIQEMKRPFELNPFNIAYPKWTNDNDDDNDAGDPRYIYIRKTALKKKYISAVYVGSYNFEKSGQKEMEDYSENEALHQEVQRQADVQAMVEAISQAPDEMIPANAALVPERTWYGIEYEGDHRFPEDKAGGLYDTNEAEDDPDDSILPWSPPQSDGIINSDDDNKTEPVNRPASYLSVERTDDPNEAVRAVIMFKSDKDNVPNKIQVDGAEYICASTSTPIMTQSFVKKRKDDNGYYYFKWKKQNYFLYFTKNKGVAPGQPFLEITVNDKVFESGKATALCADETDDVSKRTDGGKVTASKAKPYGESELPVYIHAKYEKGENTFFNKVYTASGATEKEAMAQLLEQGCTEFLDMNLNEEASLTEEDKEDDDERKAGEYVYFGYRGVTENKKERETQLLDAVYDIVCTIGEPYHPDGIQTERWQIYYAPVEKTDRKGNIQGTDLNAGTNGPPIYMYYTTPYITQQFNKKVGSDKRTNLSPSPVDYLKSPITRLCFTRYDRVPYSKDSGVDEQFGDDKRPWEYILYNDSKTPVDFNDGVMKLDSDLLAVDNKITMFAQREDGSVKKSAEITDGMVSAKAEYGELWLNQ